MEAHTKEAQNIRIKRKEDFTTNLRNSGNSIKEFEQKVTKNAKKENVAAFLFLGTKSKKSATVLLEKYPGMCALIGASYVIISPFSVGVIPPTRRLLQGAGTRERSSLFTGGVAGFLIWVLPNKNAATFDVPALTCPEHGRRNLPAVSLPNPPNGLRGLCVLLFKIFSLSV